MIRGRDTLTTIERALAKEHKKIEATDHHIAESSSRLINLQKEQAADFKNLAKLKVGLLTSGKIISRIDEAEQQVVKLLHSRERSFAALGDAIAKAKRNSKPLEDERNNQADQVEEAAKTVDTAEANTQHRLDAQPEYQAQRDKTKEAERTAMHAADKAERSTQELGQKGDPYRNDSLFMYLWNRHYGTPDYKASLFTRWIDKKVAKLIDFADARANYFRLQEIPLRLSEHAEQVEENANAEFAKLQKMDTKAQSEDGIPALRTALEQQQSKLDAIDARIEAAAAEHQQLLQKKADFATGNDNEYLRAIKYLASELTRDDLRDLRQDALATPFPEDDVIISRLLDREEEKKDIEHKQHDLKQGIQQHQRRLSELESLRSEFKRRRFDQAGSGFSDGALVAMTLADFLNGMLTRDTLWRVLEQQQRYRPYRSDPGFGSGGFGRGTVWGGGISFPRGGGGGFRLPGGFGRGGGSGGGGGGFRTGGGF